MSGAERAAAAVRAPVAVDAAAVDAAAVDAAAVDAVAVDAAAVRAPMAVRAPDCGATSTELTIAFPAVLLMIMFALQFGLYLHAAQIAEAAAQEAVEAAQGQSADPAAGRVAAAALLADLAALRSPEVTVSRSGTAVSSRVTGHAQQLIPGLALDVAATAEGPVERFVPQDS